MPVKKPTSITIWADLAPIKYICAIISGICSDPKYHEKGPEEKNGQGPQIVVQAQGLAAEEIKKGF